MFSETCVTNTCPINLPEEWLGKKKESLYFCESFSVRNREDWQGSTDEYLHMKVMQEGPTVHVNDPVWFDGKGLWTRRMYWIHISSQRCWLPTTWFKQVTFWPPLHSPLSRQASIFDGETRLPERGVLEERDTIQVIDIYHSSKKLIWWHCDVSYVDDATALCGHHELRRFALKKPGESLELFVIHGSRVLPWNVAYSCKLVCDYNPLTLCVAMILNSKCSHFISQCNHIKHKKREKMREGAGGGGGEGEMCRKWESKDPFRTTDPDHTNIAICTIIKNLHY